VAMEGQRLLSGEPPDVTVSAIAGAASWLLWSTAAWRSGDLADVVWRNDTAVSWWRDQTTSAGLGTFLDHSFEGWAESSSVEFNNRDPVEADLLTAIATADFSAEYGSFNTDRRLLARYYSMAAESEMLQRRAIDWLRQSGDRSSLETHRAPLPWRRAYCSSEGCCRCNRSEQLDLFRARGQPCAVANRRRCDVTLAGRGGLRRQS